MSLTKIDVIEAALRRTSDIPKKDLRSVSLTASLRSSRMILARAVERHDLRLRQMDGQGKKETKRAGIQRLEQT